MSKTFHSFNCATFLMPQMFTVIGMFKLANVMIIGVDIAGLQALTTVKRLV